MIADFSKKYPDYAKKLAHYKKCAKSSDMKCFFEPIDESRDFLHYISPLGELSPLDLSNEQLAIHYENLKKDRKHYEIILEALESSSLRSYSQIDDRTYSRTDSISICGKKTWSIEGNTLRTCYGVNVEKNKTNKAQEVEFYLFVKDVNQPDDY